MEVQLLWNSKPKGNIPYTSLTAFQLLCTQYGISTVWNKQTNTLSMGDHKRKLQNINLIKSSDVISLKTAEEAILNKISSFFTHSPINTRLATAEDEVNEYDLSLQLTIKNSSASKKKPHAVLVYHSTSAEQISLLSILSDEVTKLGIELKSRKFRQNQTEENTKCMNISFYLDQNSILFRDPEIISLAISTGLQRYLYQNKGISFYSYLPIQMRHRAFLKVLTELLEDKAPGKETKVNHVVQPAIQPAILTQSASIGLELEEETSSPSHENTSITSTTTAEIFFNYTTFFDVKKHSYLISGNLLIKNTGTEMLTNPLICIRSSPANSIKLGGKILPPNMTETLGVQDSNGQVQGWKYMYEDWQQHAMKSGEFWIAPLHQINIAPGTMEVHTFQISISSEMMKSMVSIDGIVSFPEQNLILSANNQIMIAFQN